MSESCRAQDGAGGMPECGARIASRLFFKRRDKGGYLRAGKMEAVKFIGLLTSFELSYSTVRLKTRLRLYSMIVFVIYFQF